MPFYRGDNPRVIGVYEAAYQFQGYITQAMSRLRDEKFAHCVFVADDMVIDPTLNEANIVARLGLDDNTAFISEIRMLDDAQYSSWDWGWQSITRMVLKDNSCEGHRFLPPVDMARELFARHGLDWRNGVSLRLAKLVMKLNAFPRRMPFIALARKLRRIFRSDEKAYPLAYGYSDIISVPASAIQDFCFYCGVMAGMRVFVECAIPTALAFSCAKLSTTAKLGLKSERGVDNYFVRERFEKLFQFSYRKLVDGFPEDYLFIHPVKLSKWKDLP